MMAPTHAVLAALTAVPLLVVVPELAAIGALAAMLGGILPDLDLYSGHRKTLHYPVYGSLAALVAVPVAAVFPTTGTVVATMVLVGAALHAVTDIAGAGLELRPWEGQSSRAVYNHFHDRWETPMRLVRYDGAPEDVLLAAGATAIITTVFSGPVVAIAVALLGVGVVYAVLRKPLARLAAAVFPRLPPALHPYLPDRYFEAH